MSDVVIRRAEVDDAHALAALRWRFKVEEDGDDVPQVGGDVARDSGDIPRDSGEAPPGTEEVPQGEAQFIAECAEWLRARIDGPWRGWLAEVDGRPCGHVFVGLVEKVPSPFPSSDALGYVTNFYVTPEQRNRGLGKALLDQVNGYAHAHRLDTLIVWPSERSAPLYRRCGFGGPEELLEQPVAPS